MRAEYDFSRGVRGKFYNAALPVKKLWVSCSKFTIQVNTDGTGVIIWTAPIARKFLGQQIRALYTWTTMIAGGFREEEL